MKELIEKFVAIFQAATKKTKECVKDETFVDYRQEIVLCGKDSNYHRMVYGSYITMGNPNYGKTVGVVSRWLELERYPQHKLKESVNGYEVSIEIWGKSDLFIHIILKPLDGDMSKFPFESDLKWEIAGNPKDGKWWNYFDQWSDIPTFDNFGILVDNSGNCQDLKRSKHELFSDS